MAPLERSTHEESSPPPLWHGVIGGRCRCCAFNLFAPVNSSAQQSLQTSFFFISIDSRLVVDKFQLIIDDFSLPFVINRAQETIKNNKTKVKYTIQFGWLVRLLPAGRMNGRSVGRVCVCVVVIYFIIYSFFFVGGRHRSNSISSHTTTAAERSPRFVTSRYTRRAAAASYRIASYRGWLL